MSALARPAVRFAALIGLWGLVGAVLWIVLVQLFLLALNPFCHLERPAIARLEVVSVDRNQDSQITDYVTAKHGDATRVLSMGKAEAADLHANDEVWILDAWYADGLRPTQFRLTPQRLLLEYPALLLLPAAFGLWRVRKARVKADAAPPPPVRRTFTDDFHLRAQRFAKPEAPAAAPSSDQSEASPDKADRSPVSPEEPGPRLIASTALQRAASMWASPLQPCLPGVSGLASSTLGASGLGASDLGASTLGASAGFTPLGLEASTGRVVAW